MPEQVEIPMMEVVPLFPRREANLHDEYCELFAASHAGVVRTVWFVVHDRGMAEEIAQARPPSSTGLAAAAQVRAAGAVGAQDIAALFSQVLGETVSYVDDDSGLRASMGAAFDTMRTYLRCERGSYDALQHDPAITALLERPQETLHDYITAHQEMFR